MSRYPVRWRLRIRRTGRRVRRGLGLPALRPRTWLLAILVFLGLIYVGATVVADFVARLGQYAAPQHYEPKDFQREPTSETQGKTP